MTPFKSDSDICGLLCAACTTRTGTAPSVPALNTHHRHRSPAAFASPPPRLLAALRTGRTWFRRPVVSLGVWFTVRGCPHPPMTEEEDSHPLAYERVSQATSFPWVYFLECASILGQHLAEKVNRNSSEENPNAPNTCFAYNVIRTAVGTSRLHAPFYHTDIIMGRSKL